jgi:hypothetical protein
MKQLIAQVEANRLKFLKLFKKTKLINNIVLGVIALGMGATFLWLLEQNMTLALIIVAILIIALFIYSRLVKKWLGKQTYAYIFNYYKTMDAFLYNDRPFEQIEVKEEQGFELEEIRALKVLKDEVSIISRNLVTGTIDNIPFALADAGVRVQKDKRIEVAFFGKIVRFQAKERQSNHIIYHARRNDKLPLAPGLLDLKLIDSGDGIMVFGTDEELPKAHKNILKHLNKLPLNEYLEDFTLVLFEDKGYLMLSYADAIMSVVYETPLNETGLTRYVADLGLINNLLKEIAN